MIYSMLLTYVILIKHLRYLNSEIFTVLIASNRHIISRFILFRTILNNRILPNPILEIEICTSIKH